MLPNAVPAAATGLSVDLRRFPWMSRLAADYVHDFDRLAGFYNGNPATPTAWRDAIARVQRHPRQRDAVVDVIAAQQRRRGAASSAVAAAEQLRDPQTVAVVTGQQAGLFGGPLYTLLKTITAIRLAARVREQHHVPAVAIFWADGEDHDWEEVRSCTVLDADAGPRSIALPTSPASARPVGRVTLDTTVEAALNDLKAALPPTEFTPRLLEDLARLYRPGVGMSAAFAAWIEAILGPLGLVVYESSDPATKPLVADLFAHEIAMAGASAHRAIEAGTRLQQAGYHAQVTPAEGSLALFRLNDGREPIRVEGDIAVVGDTRQPLADLVARARSAPQEFSPNVLLRPLVQDTLFPTVAYVGGPGETAYFAQLKEIYAAHGVPMPLVAPRPTVTLLDANGLKFLTRHDVPLESLKAQDESVLNQLLEAALPPAVEASIESAMKALDERLAAVTSAVTAVDATLEGAARSTLTRMQDDLKKLQAKVIQAAKKKDETLRRQFKNAQAQAFPGGAPQERVVGFVWFLNKYGPGLVERLCQEPPLDQPGHWVLTP
ncbi:MAG TPA: bacillithiol biosynthesis cysteine-adding enzyme BshC [Vicinamibacterales bacterium]|nr:bacillithiol biosynthesis cysteine-adding enzyme BshC [Vicinamibacterales bacterium]